MAENAAQVIRKLLAENSVVRIAALGSSNTQRRIMYTHWFDYMELALKHQFGKGSVLCCNMGVGGETSAEILERFDRDCGIFQPHLAIVTCGGNDAVAEKNISDAMFADNLREIYRRFRAMDTTVFFQTYYSCDLENRPPDYAERFLRYMQMIREVAQECDCFLQDNLRRWELLRAYDIDLYRMLMCDPMHVNEHGNAIIGLDWLRALQLDIPKMVKDGAPCGFFGAKVLDLLQNRQ